MTHMLIAKCTFPKLFLYGLKLASGCGIWCRSKDVRFAVLLKLLSSALHSNSLFGIGFCQLENGLEQHPMAETFGWSFPILRGIDCRFLLRSKNLRSYAIAVRHIVPFKVASNFFSIETSLLLCHIYASINRTQVKALASDGCSLFNDRTRKMQMWRLREYATCKLWLHLHPQP